MADAKTEPVAKHEPPKELEQRAQTQQFKGRAKRTPADQAEYFYSIRKLHIAFFVSSLLTLVGFLLVFWDDYDRDWKNFQRVHQDIENSRVAARIVRYKADVEARQEELQKLSAEIHEYRRTSAPEYEPLEKRLAELKGRNEKRTQDKNFKQADYMTVRWEYEEAKHHLEEARKSQDVRLKKIESHFKEVSDKWTKVLQEREKFEREFQEVNTEVVALQAKLLELDAPIREKIELQEKITGQLEAALRRYGKERPSPENRIRDLPLLDFFSPTLQIKQLILPDIKESMNFEIRVEKVDRCQTCHVKIDDPEYAAERDERGLWRFRDEALASFVDHATGRAKENCDTCLQAKADRRELRVPHGSWTEDDEIRYVSALRAHPQLDVYLKSDSAHPMTKFGCTVCHGGDGRDTEFSRVVHTPNSERQQKDWERRNDYHHRELWDLPMLPTKHIYASCRKCHTDDVEIEAGGDYVAGMRLFERVGCYACHRTDTYQILAKDTDPVKNPKFDVNRKNRRPGPPLTHIRDKVSEDWMYKWVLDPKHFRLTTRMPRFFGQSNARTLHELYDLSTGAVSKVEKPVTPQEVDSAIAASMVKYLYGRSESRSYPAPPGGPGDIGRGEKLFHQVGCMACHTVQPDEKYAVRNNPGNRDDLYRAPKGTSWYLSNTEFGPNLNAIGSKTNEKWLLHWLKNPSHYFADTRMPSLRLTDAEAADLAAFLLAQRKPAWETEAGMPRTEEINPRLVDHLLFEGLIKKTPYRGVQEELKNLSAEDKLLRLGKRAVLNSGCFACHEVKADPEMDWTALEGIGVEFSGSQPIGNKAVDRMDFGFAHWDEGVNYHGVSFLHGATGEPYRQFDQSALRDPNPENVRVRHTRQDWIFHKLLDPRVYDGGKLATKPPDELLRMPNFYLNEREAELLTTFLLSFTNENSHRLLEEIRIHPQENRKSLQRGWRLVVENNCRSCHRLSLDRFGFTYDRIETVDGKPRQVVSRDVLEGRLGDPLSPEQAESIAEDLGLEAADFDEMYRPDWTSDSRTLRLHPLLGKPGQFLFRKGERWFLMGSDGDTVSFDRRTAGDGGDVLSLIRSYKESQGIAMDGSKENPEGRYPPMLRTQGGKTQPEWLFDFLKNPSVIREGLVRTADVGIRMPTFAFTDEEAASLVRYFHVRDALPSDSFPHVRLPERTEEFRKSRSREIEWAREFAPELCLKCHVMGGVVPERAEGDRVAIGPDLSVVARRLRPRWYYAWIRDAKSIYPKTIMTDPNPAAAPGGKESGYDALVEYTLNADHYPLPEKK